MSRSDSASLLPHLTAVLINSPSAASAISHSCIARQTCLPEAANQPAPASLAYLLICVRQDPLSLSQLKERMKPRFVSSPHALKSLCSGQTPPTLLLTSPSPQPAPYTHAAFPLPRHMILCGECTSISAHAIHYAISYRICYPGASGARVSIAKCSEHFHPSVSARGEHSAQAFRLHIHDLFRPLHCAGVKLNPTTPIAAHQTCK
jgi:hypothetical protein